MYRIRVAFEFGEEKGGGQVIDQIMDTVHIPDGIGADEMIVPSLFGARRVNPSQDLDEETLTEIAKATGGRYFRARDTEELEKIYQLLDELEPIARETQSFRPKTSLYLWPLSIATLLGVMVMLLRVFGR